MAASLSLLIVVPVSLEVWADEAPFVTTWKTTTAGESITMPVDGASGAYTVDWGDGNTSVDVTGDQTHVYDNAGTYTVSISGDFTRIYLNEQQPNADKLQSIEQWGEIRWKSMKSAFQGATSMTYRATDIPDLSLVTNMHDMFRSASKFNGNLSAWNVSGVTDMSGMFAYAKFFDGDLSTWDVSGVTDMSEMFRTASKFNVDLSAWDTSSVTNMGWMFVRASSFNADLSAWNVSGVTDMSGMFSHAESFDSDLSAWNVSNVIYMHVMFFNSNSFNGDISAWDTSSVTNMGWMFYNSNSFNADLSAWNVSGVTDMYGMFSHAESFNADLSAWNVSGVTDMSEMFLLADAFEQNLGEWYIVLDDTVIDYDGAPGIVGSVSAQNSVLDGQNPTYSLGSGGDSDSFEMDGNNLVLNVVPVKSLYTVNILSTGDFGTDNSRMMNITVASYVYSPPATSAGQDQTVPEGSTVILSGTVTGGNGDPLTYGWTHDSVLDIHFNATSPAITFVAPQVSANTTITFTLTADDGTHTYYDSLMLHVTDTPAVTAPAAAFVTTWQTTGANERITIPVGGATGIYTVDWGDGHTSVNVTGNQRHVYDDAGIYAVSITGDFTRLFLAGGPANAQKLQSIEQWGDMRWESMERAFKGASNMVYRATDVPNLSGVPSMHRMFLGASSFDGDLSGWDVLTVTDMSRMFRGASSFDGDLSGWNVSSVTDMSGMFESAASFNGDISAWDVSSVTDMARMFYSSGAFDGDISAWDVSSVTDMGNMFRNAYSFDGDLNNWDVSAVTDMSRMFHGASSFDGEISGWNVSGVTTMYGMFQRAPSFNGDISAWDVSGVANMDSMFNRAQSFEQNLGNWYVTLDDAVIEYDDATRQVTTISPQNAWLEDNHNIAYSVDGQAGDGAQFEIDGDILKLKSVPGSVQGSYDLTILSTGDFGTSNSRGVVITVAGIPSNTSPDVDAGSDQIAQVGDTVTLSGTATDDDSTNLTYGWTHDSNLDITFSDAAALNTTFVVPAVDDDTYVTFTLTVSDDTSDVTASTVITISHDGAPVVSVSADQTVQAGDTVTLSGTATDDDSTNLTYGWTHDSNLDITFSDAAALNTTFVVPAVDDDTEITFTLTVSDDTSDVTASTVITISHDGAPVVSVSADQTVQAGDTVTLSGTATDDDSTNLTYGWTHDSNLDITFSDAAALNTTFVVPAVDDDTEITFTLTVSDDTSDVAADTTVTISHDGAPVVSVSADQTVQAGDTVTLSGTATDDDSTNLTYGWTHDSNLDITFSDAAALNTTFVVPAVDDDTEITFTLTVSDDTSDVAADTTVTISHDGAPVVSVSADQTVQAGDTVTLSGTATDDDSPNLTYGWAHDSDLAITLSDPTALNTTFVVPAVDDDTYVTFTLTVSDDTSEITASTVITINHDGAPSVNVGADQTVQAGDTVTLSGIATDDDSLNLTYGWTHDSDLAITLSDPTALNTTFVVPAVDDDTYVTFTLTVSDDTSEITASTVITINHDGAPSVNVGADQTVQAGDTVTLSGIATDDDSLNLTYGWTHDSDLAITLSDPTALNTTFVVPAVDAGINVTFTLTVMDDTNIVTDSLVVTIATAAVPHTNLIPTDNIMNTDSLELAWAQGIATFSIGGHTYAAVAAGWDDGVQILDVTDPYDITAAGKIHDNANLTLDGARAIATFSTGGHTYAAVAAEIDDGVQILNVTDPYNITATDRINNNGKRNLNNPMGIATFSTGGHAYAAVAAGWDDGVQILNVTDPYDITVADRINDNWKRNLDGPWGITVFSTGGHTYAAVTAYNEDGVQILDVTDPYDITAAGKIDNGRNLNLDAARDIAVFSTGGHIYAAVTAYNDDGVQILDVTDPYDITAAGRISNDKTIGLDGPRGISIFYTGDHVYAAIAVREDGVQILNVTDPYDITAAGKISNNENLELEGAEDIAIFRTGGHIYAAVAAHHDHGVQILNVNIASSDDTLPVITLTGSNSVTMTVGTPYADAGATCTDNIDGPIAPTSTSTVNTNQTGTYGVTYSCSDTAGNDAVEVSRTVAVVEAGVNNNAPTVEAGSDQTVEGGATVTLSGTVTDKEGDYLTYEWTHDSSLAIHLANSTSSSTTFTAPVVDAGINVTFTLAVSDGTSSATDSTVITINYDDPPSAYAGADQTVQAGDTVTLSGTATDDDSTNLTYGWTHDSDLDIAFSDAAALNTTFVVPAVNTGIDVTFTLTVSDDTNIVTDSLVVTITAVSHTDTVSTNSPPDIDAGSDQIVEEGASVTLTGTATDIDGDRLTYLWNQTAGSPTVVLTGPDTLLPVFTAPAVSSDTEFVFEMTVSDDSDRSTDTVKVTVRDVPDNTPFITTWQTTTAGESITIPVGGASGAYTVDWGDGNIFVDVTGDQTHAYDDAGTYTVSISGDFTRIYLNEQQPNADKLQSIEQWGDARWESMKSAFHGASNVAYNAVDTPVLSDVTTMKYMFYDASSFDGDLSGWNVSHVRDMSGVFWGASSFDGDLSGWDVSSVTNMKRMLSDASSFNGDISEWNVSNVRDMAAMFFGASVFNADISGWDVSNVTDMAAMFAGASAFNADISSWDVSSVTITFAMFMDAKSFDADISGWDVSNVTEMHAMFRNAKSFDADISGWDVSNVNGMSEVFYKAKSFDADISGWDVSQVTNMRQMFESASSFNADISGWDVSNVTHMNYMLSNTRAFDQNLGAWYIVLDSTSVDGADRTVGEITAQNSFLDGQNPIYGMGSGGDSDYFEMDGSILKLKDVLNRPAGSSYTVTITSTGEFGTNNSRTLAVTASGSTNNLP